MIHPLGLDAIIFDLDGTLIDSLPGIEFSVDHSLAEGEFSPRQLDLAPLIGPPIRQIFAHLLPEISEQQLSKLESSFRTCYDSTGWRKTTLHGNAAATLRELERAGARLFVATNKPARPTRLILEALGILGLFREVLCRDSRTPAFISKADMLRTLIERHQLKPAQSLYLGDTYDDYLAASEAGVPVALVQHGNQIVGEVFARGPVKVLHSLLELLEQVNIGETA